MRNIVSEEGQSVFDLSVQGYGSIQGIFWILEDNNIESLDSEITPGTTIKLRDEIINEAVEKEIRTKGKRPVTALPREGNLAFSDEFTKEFE